MGQKLFWAVGLYIPAVKVLPSVLHGVVGGAIMWKIIQVCGWEKTVPLTLFCARRFCQDEWFEKAVMAFGAGTGSTSTGLALVRAIDLDSQSHAGDTHGVYATLMSWKDAFVGLTPIWLMSGVTLTCGIGFGIMVIFIVLGFMFFDTKRKVA